MTISTDSPVNDHNHQDAGRCRRRKPLWEFYSPLKCPAVGICLSFAEHQRILKKCLFTVKNHGPYDLHKLVMVHLNDENPVSRKIDHFLNHKYRKDLLLFDKLGEAAFVLEWRNRLRSGQVEGIFWEAAGNPGLSENAVAEIYGDIHMAGHTGVVELMKARHAAFQQTEAHKKTARILMNEKKRVREAREEIVRLNTMLKDTRLRLEKQRHPPAQTPQRFFQERAPVAEPDNKRMLRQIDSIQRDNDRLVKKILLQEAENRRLQIRLTDLESAHQHQADELKTLLVGMGPLLNCGEPCDPRCPKVNVCARRILIVGGLTKMKHLYRDLIESIGGEFDYHDGCVKTGTKKLEAQVGRSDLILCPVNCNSHGACSMVKALCKKMNKPLKMLPQSSLSVISGALMENGRRHRQSATEIHAETP